MTTQLPGSLPVAATLLPLFKAPHCSCINYLSKKKKDKTESQRPPSLAGVAPVLWEKHLFLGPLDPTFRISLESPNSTLGKPTCDSVLHFHGCPAEEERQMGAVWGVKL